MNECSESRKNEQRLPSSLAAMKLRVTLSNGDAREVIGIGDTEAWMNKFVGRGTSQLGDWLEVVPKEGEGRTFVRASDVVAVHLIDEETAEHETPDARS